MFRFSLVVCVSLIFGITAKPYKPWNKFTDETVQDTIMSIDDNGKMSWGVEVEPKEDMDETSYDIDPQMKIWKSMTGSGQDKQPLKPEEDLDDLFHPSVTELLRSQIQKKDAIPAADIHKEPWQEVAKMKFNQEPEEDRDDVDHPVFSEVAWEEPEQDLDDVYLKGDDELDKYLAPLVAAYKTGVEIHVEPERKEKDEPVQMVPLLHAVRVHLEPEEDLDDLYHKDVLQPLPDQGETEDVVPVDVPTQRKYSEPEEDLDAIYHL